MSFTTAARLGSAWAFTLVVFSLHNLTTSFSFPEFLIPSSKGHKLYILSWVPAQTPHSARFVFIPTSSSFSTQRGSAPMPLGFPSWTPLLSSLPGLLCPSGLLPKGFSQPVSQVDEVCPPKAHAIGFADPPSLFLQKLKTHFVIAVLKTASSHHITSHHHITPVFLHSQTTGPVRCLPELAPSPAVSLQNLLDDLKDEHCSGEDNPGSQDLSRLLFKNTPDTNPQLLYCSLRPVSPLGKLCPYWSTSTVVLGLLWVQVSLHAWETNRKLEFAFLAKSSFKMIFTLTLQSNSRRAMVTEEMGKWEECRRGSSELEDNCSLSLVSDLLDSCHH